MLTRLVIHLCDHVLREVEHPLQSAWRDVQQQAKPAGNALRKPDMRHRRGQANVAHPLTAHLAARHLGAAAVAHDALVTDPLVLAAGALKILHRAKDALTEQPVHLWLQRPVVNRLRLRDLAVRPRQDLGG